jgi:peptidoglycan/xylan/chitin deacetylase (PgdA/CDA1 family)
MVASKRDRLARLLTVAGITRALEFASKKSCLLVLTYHRIGDRETAKYDAAVYEATAEAFSEQVQLLQRLYHVISLAEATELILHPSRLRHRHVLITFDDGYRDNHDLALPVLKAHGATGVFFLPTSFIGTNRIPWWDQLADMVLRSTREVIHLQYPERLTFHLPGNQRRVIRSLLAIYKSAAMKDPARFFADVANAAGVEHCETVEERQFMNWDEARHMVKSGMDIGSHTHSHELLAKQTREQQMWECLESKRIIHQELGVQVDSMAYPVGMADCFNQVSVECLQQTGYRTAFSYVGAANFPEKIRPFSVERLTVDYMHVDQFRLRKAMFAMGLQLDKVQSGGTGAG